MAADAPAKVPVQTVERRLPHTFEDSAALKAFASEDDQYCAITAGNEYELGLCLNKQAEFAERELNETYQEMMRLLSLARRVALRKDERSWIKWRKAECARQVEDAKNCVGGCGVPSTMHVVCMTKEAYERAKQIKTEWQR